MTSVQQLCHYINGKKRCIITMLLVQLLIGVCGNKAWADYDIPSGSTVNASAITGQSGVLTIEGTLNVNSNTSLLNFTTIIIEAPNGQIFWANNSDLTLSASVNITINSGALGLQPTSGSASKRLIVGTTIIAVANTSSNNAAFSFAEFNAAGGLPQFFISAGATICYGTVYTATLTPVNTTINYDCSWTVNNAGTVSPASATSFNTPQTITLTPTNSASAKTYTITCTVKKSGDPDPITIKTISVTVNPVPSAPSAVNALPASICTGSSATVNATSAGNLIDWYQVSSGGTSTGTSNSGSNFTVTPAATTTYYAESRTNGTGCISTSRVPVTVTVSPASVGGTISGATTVCAGSNIIVLSLGAFTGSITRWESSADNFATSPITISNTTASLNITNLASTTYYRAVVTSGACSAAYSSAAVVAVSNPGTWLGVNTDWNSALNWCNGTVPTLATDVVIPNGLLNYPVIAGTALARNITVATGGSANIQVSGILKISGSITATAGVNIVAGTLELAGTTGQVVRADAFVSSTIANLIISNSTAGASAFSPSVNINSAGGMLKLSGALSYGNVNNAIVQTNDNLTLLSSAVATAAVADITNNNANSGNDIAGKVVIERYIPGHRAWRLLTAPVTSASNVLISNAWQEGATPVTNPSVITAANNPNPGYGTHITFGAPAVNGYDQGVNGNTSIRYLNATGWNGVPTATNNGAVLNSGKITDQPGYMLFVRGDRSTALASGVYASVSPTVLRVNGNLNTGNVSIPLQSGMIVGSSQFRVLNNPFASAISFHKIAGNAANNSAGIADAFYLWDPNITGSNGVGGWVALSYNNLSGTYDRTVLSGGGSTINNSGDIQSGSAFVIDYPGSASSIEIKESNKATGSNISQFRPVTNPNQVRVSLLAKNADGSESVNDALLVTYDSSYSSSIDKADMKKLPNFAENIAVDRNGEQLVIERRKTFIGVDSIPFRISQMKNKNYLLEIQLNEMQINTGTVALLEDKFLSKSEILQTASANRYAFSTVPNTASAAVNRFSVQFKPVAVYAGMAAELKQDDAVISWKLSSSTATDHFEVERSSDGISFYAIGKVAFDNNNVTAEYYYTDAALSTGQWYYRIKAVAVNQAFVYSKAAVLTVINKRSGIFIFPNPVTGNTITVQMNAVTTGKYSMQLAGINGDAIQQFVVIVKAGNSTQQLRISQQLTPGIYLLKITDGLGKHSCLPVYAQPEN